MHKPIAAGIAVIGWGVLIVGLTACGSGSATQVATQAPSTSTSQAATQVPRTPTSQVATQAPATSASAGGSPLENLDPCTVLTQNDATAFFGVPSVPGMPSPGSTTAFCVYATADQTGHISLNLRYDPKGALSSQDFAPLKTVNQDVPGLADGAFFDSTSGALTVAKGSLIVRVSGTLQAAKIPLDKLKALVQIALGRLP
jgi:hypothetical protein